MAQSEPLSVHWSMLTSSLTIQNRYTLEDFHVVRDFSNAYKLISNDLNHHFMNKALRILLAILTGHITVTSIDKRAEISHQ